MLYEQLFRALPVAVAVVDADLVVRDANDAYVAMAGASRSTAIGAPLVVALPNGAAVDGGQFDVAADGKTTRVRMIPLPETHPARAVAVLVDPSDDARYVELCSAVRTIKHEINNPLTGALGNITLMLRRPDLDEKMRKRLTTAEQELKKIGQIVVKLSELAPSPQPRAREAVPQPDDPAL